MKRKVVKSFFYDIFKMQQWLNHMAEQGYRLIDSKGLLYTFEECRPNEYEYRVEYVGSRKDFDSNSYESMLSDLGYDVIRRNISLGQKSYGKRRLNLVTGEFENRSASLPDSKASSIFIIERMKDDKPFVIYTDSRDLIAYYSRIRNTFIITGIMVFLIVFFGSTRLAFINNDAVRALIGITVKTIAAVLGALIVAVGIKAAKRISSLR